MACTLRFDGLLPHVMDADGNLQEVTSTPFGRCAPA